MNPASNGLPLLLVLVACTPPKAPDTLDGGAPEPSASAVAVSATVGVSTATRAPTSAPSASASEAPPTPPSPVASTAVVPPPAPPASSAAPATAVVPCKTVDDCWVSAKRFPATPIARPKHLKGKPFKPCVDGEVAPTCGSNGACGLLGYDC